MARILWKRRCRWRNQSLGKPLSVLPRLSTLFSAFHEKSAVAARLWGGLG
jgi:hypothetical protein